MTDDPFPSTGEPPRERGQSVALVHCIGWTATAKKIQLAPGLCLCRASDHPALKLYERMCDEWRFDDGEPFTYNTLIELGPEFPSESIHPGDPYYSIDRVCNLIALLARQSVGMALWIHSMDNFASQDSHHYCYYCSSEEMSFYLEDIADLDDHKLLKLRQMWQTADSLRGQERTLSRVTNALTYFYYAWRAPYVEQACLNLSIVLETLFAPHHQSEVSHQIAFNVSRFVGNSSGTRQEVFTTIKHFYNHRSQIVHGGIPDPDKIGETVKTVFRLCSSILEQILLDERLATTFNEEKLRKALLKKYLFK